METIRDAARESARRLRERGIEVSQEEEEATWERLAALVREGQTKVGLPEPTDAEIIETVRQMAAKWRTT